MPPSKPPLPPEFRACVAAGILVASIACSPADSRADDDGRRAERPDLVLALIDTWRWDALGANAGTTITPELDQLARRGVRFSRAIATAPWTLPSVASTLTGHYPSGHGAFGRYQDAAEIRKELPTLAELLGEAGYRTVAVTSAPFRGPDFGFDRGFETHRHLPSEDNRVPRAGEVVDLALELAQSDDERPLFLMLHVFDPHLPLDPPEPWDQRWTADYRGSWKPPLNLRRQMRSGDFAPAPNDLSYLRGLYDGEVSYTSHELGRFFDRLEQLRTGRERLLVLSADHGEEFGEHGEWEHGHAMYQELVQVPLVVVPPDSWAISPSVVDAQVRLVDLFPTFLEAASFDSPDGLPGLSLAPLLHGRSREDRPALSEREHIGRASFSYRSGSYTLIVHLDDNSMELYDQIEDPRETTDIAATQPALVDSLRMASEALRSSMEGAEGAPGVGPDLDPDLLEQLRSLGYVDENSQD